VHVIRADVAAKCIELVRSLAPHARAIFQNCDMHYLRMERQAIVENNSDLLARASAMKLRELQISQSYDVTVTHSEAERQILKNELPNVSVVVMPLIEDVIEVNTPIELRKDFMFLGGYGHPPNVDAVHWLLNDIWPELSKACPEARLLLVGANPPDDIRRAACERIIVTGLVDKLEPWFARTRVFLAALRYGAGSKGKVLSSMAHGVPVVATDIASEGMAVVDEVSIFQANTANDIIHKADEIYHLDEKRWRKASENAQNYIRSHHSFNSNVDQLLNLLSN
jgi:glycosyltransferase involved in cell wall biosynthesis